MRYLSGVIKNVVRNISLGFRGEVLVGDINLRVVSIYIVF